MQHFSSLQEELDAVKKQLKKSKDRLRGANQARSPLSFHSSPLLSPHPRSSLFALFMLTQYNTTRYRKSRICTQSSRRSGRATWTR